MAEQKPSLDQLLDGVGQQADNSNDLIDIGDNLNMEDVLSGVLNQTNNDSLSTLGRERLKRQRRGNRMKVFDNGYIFTYDKDSSCGQRSFWRCERKNECPARVHTNPFTNQIIKRLHSHSHEPPNPDELPPWLLLKGEDANTPPPGDYHSQTASPPGACVILPCPMLPSASTLQNRCQQSDQHEVKPAVTEPEPEDMVEPPRKRSRKLKIREAPPDVVSVKELFLQHPTEFWELFEATRKMVHFLKGDEGPSMAPCVTSTNSECDSAVDKFLDNIRMAKYKPTFAKFSMDVLRSLSVEELCRICRNEADALCIHRSLKIRFAASSEASSAVKLFVREMSSGIMSEPMYQMIILKSQTKEEFVSLLEKKGLIDTTNVERFCVPGPGGIKVELSDDIVSSWKDESVFHINVDKGVCRLDVVVQQVPLGTTPIFNH
ncbi:FLYWCH zinc finger domain protein [Ostertagia ostertagi]